MSIPDMEVHHQEDGWIALYVNGTLDKIVKPDNEYLIAERVFSLVGVKNVHDDAFLLGTDDRSQAAGTLDEIAIYRKHRDERRAEAKQLREQARLLLEEADIVEEGR